MSEALASRPCPLPWRVPAAALALALSAVLAYAAIGRPGAEHASRHLVFAVAALLLAAASCFSFVAHREDRWGGLGTFRVGPWWVLYFTVAFGVTSLAWVSPQSGSAAVIDPSGVPLAVVAATVAMVSWSAGYAARWAAPLKAPLHHLARWAAPPGAWALRTPAFPAFLYAIGLSFRLVRIATGRFAYLANARRVATTPFGADQLLAQGEQLARYALIFAAIDAAAGSRSFRARLTLVALLVVESAFSLASGVKGEFLLTFFVVCFVYVAVRGRVSRLAVGAVIVGLLVLIPVNQAYREYVRDAQGGVVSPRQAVVAFPGIAARVLGDSPTGSLLVDSVSTVSGRLREVDNLSLIIQRTPSDIPFRSPAELVYAPVVSLIPRAVWPDKPVLSYGYAFSQEYYNLPSSVFTSSAVTVPGDLYRHAGWVGIVLGMALLGTISRGLEEAFHPAGDLRKAVIYVPFFVMLLNLEIDVSSLLASIVQSLVILTVVARVAFARASAEGPRASRRMEEATI